MRGVLCTCHLTSTSSSDRTTAFVPQRDTLTKSSSYRIVRPRSPQAPKHFQPTDPQLVRNLRLFLAQAAARPAGYLLELEELVTRKLDVSTTVLEQLLCEGLTAHQQTLTDAHLSEVEAGKCPSTVASRHLDAFRLQYAPASSSKCQQLALKVQPLVFTNMTIRDNRLDSVGLDKMLQLFSSKEVLHLLEQQPAILAAPMASWLEFFEVYGFSRSQVKNLISQTPEVITKLPHGAKIACHALEFQ